MTHPDTKPEALRLADRHQSVIASIVEPQRRKFHADTAACLRRLHAECESLRTQLQEQALQSLSAMGQDDATIADLRTQLAEARAEDEALTTALAACRDVFPLIEPNDPAELPWLDAVAFPGAVPAYVKAKADALRADARRYRWLRDGCDTKGSAASRIAMNCYGLEWDAAIDTAMKEGG